MTVDEIIERTSSGMIPVVDGVDPANAKYIDGKISISGWVVIPVSDISPSLESSTDLAVVVDGSRELGTLCFIRDSEGEDPETFNKWRYAAYLNDCSLSDLPSPLYRFKSAYLVISEGNYLEYKDKYMVSAPLWGRFSHWESQFAEPQIKLGEIKAVGGIFLPTEHHEESFSRYCRASNALDRFLKLYHCVELLFDYIVVAKIRALGDDLLGFPKVLSEFGSGELDRLKGIIKDCCSNTEDIARAFVASSNFSNQRADMFRLFGKSGDPLKEDKKWALVLSAIDANEVSFSDFSRLKISNKREEYDKLIVEIAAYWIYRVRSSIAHSRVGEYLLNDKNSDFVGLFAEPLLLEVVRQIFSSNSLMQLKRV